MKYRLEYLFLKGGMDLFAALGPRRRLRWGARLGRTWFRLDGKHRRLAVENMVRGLGIDESSAKKLALRNFENLGRNVAEFSAFTRIGEALDGISIEGARHLEEALAKGRGAFLATGHFGNWELCGAAFSRRFPVTVVARAMKNPLSERVIADRRRSAGIRVMGHRNATREILRKVRNGEVVAVLLDQNTSHREAVFVPFLGRPAAVNFGLALLAAKTGAPVLPVFAIREGEGRHRVSIEPPVRFTEEADRQEALGINTARITAALERHLRRFPDQWFWVHNRWKNQPRPGQKVYQP